MRKAKALDFVGIGAARAGTTWMAKCLAEHPGIFVPVRKELHLFNTDKFFRQSLKLNRKGRKIVRRYFQEADKNQICGEITPRYMINRAALERIRLNYRSAKIIVILRDPVERAFSQYSYFKWNKGKELCQDFETALTGAFYEDYIVKSTYSPLVRNVFNTFPTSQIVWILYDDICERPLEVIRGLYKCLGADSRYTPDTMDQLVNYADSSESGKKNISDRNRLLEQVNCRSHLDRDDLQSEVRGRVYRRFFKEDIRKLEELLGVELAKWKPEI